MTSSVNHTDIISKFLDTESIHPSGNDGLEEFDYLLEEDGTDGASGFDRLLTSSIGSIGIMEFQFEMLESCDTDQDEDEARLPDNNADCRQDHSPTIVTPSPPPHKQKQQGFQIQMDMVDFDPSAQEEHIAHHQRQTSYSDISMSMCSVQSSSAPSPANQRVPDESLSSAAIDQHQCSKYQYNEALQKLAESMQRSEMTRRHVMMHRSMLSAEQQRMLYLAKERLNQQMQQQQQQSSPTIMTSFFNGSARGSFAEKMEQSRKKIRMYMSQVNQTTL